MGRLLRICHTRHKKGGNMDKIELKNDIVSAQDIIDIEVDMHSLAEHYDIKVKYAIAAYLIGALGYTQRKASEKIGIGEQRMSVYKKGNTGFNQLIVQFAGQKVMTAYGKATNKMIGLMDSEDEKVIHNSSKYIMDHVHEMNKQVVDVQQKDAVDVLLDMVVEERNKEAVEKKVYYAVETIDGIKTYVEMEDFDPTNDTIDPAELG